MVVLLLLGLAYGVARWYQDTEPPQQMGVSFIPDYASSLGLDPQTTMTALENIGVRDFRLVSYWNDIEPTKGKYDFSQLDWEFASANASHSKVLLVVGLRQPRWPECHAPDWVNTQQPTSDWLPQLEQFMTSVINRYKNNPALSGWQLENEYFNNFGQCYNYSRQRLVSEYNLVKRLDPNHPILVPRSNNYPNLQLDQPRPDIAGLEIYHSVWAPLLNRHFTYPMPSWYYSFLAGATKIITGRDSIIHEAQAEPWPAPGQALIDLSLAQQQKLLSANQLKQYFSFAKTTKIPKVYWWGAEYWYYRKVKLHDPSLWNVAAQEFKP